MTVPAAHPRLWFSTPALVARATDNFHQLYGANGAAFDPKDDPVEHAFGYVMTKDPAMARYAIDYALGVVDPKLDDPSPSTSSSDPYRWFGEQVALIYDWCYDAMTPAERDTLLARWNRYVDNENHRLWGGLGMQANNYYWGHLRTSLEWGIATSGDDAEADGFIANALDTQWTGSFGPFASGAGAGGVPMEGTEYGKYNLDYPVIPLVSAHALGRKMYDENDFFAGSVMYLAYSATPTATRLSGNSSSGYEVFPFDDDQSWHDGGTARGYGPFLQAAANEWRDQPIGQYARHLIATIDPVRPDYLKVLDDPGVDRPLDDLPLDYYAPGPGYLYTRDRWGAQSTTAFVQLGQANGIGHHHQDYGTFQMWQSGRWLTRESSSYSDVVAGFDGNGLEGAAHTLAHNGILFEGQGDNAYYIAGSSDNTCDGPPQVTRVDSQAAYSFAAVDLSKSYRAHASTVINSDNTLRDDNAHVASVVREFLFVRSLGTLVVFDRLASTAFDRQDAEAAHGVTISPHVTDAAQVRKTFLAHFETAPTLAGNVATATIGDQVIRSITAYPSDATAKVIDERANGGAPIGQYRLEVTTRGAAQSYMIHVLQGRAVGDADVTASVTETSGAFTLVLTKGGATSTIVLQKGMQSTGGSLDGTAFRDHVQAISVDANGPHWGS